MYWRNAQQKWGKLMNVKLVPISRHHQRVIATAIYNAKPTSKDRDRMDDWINMCNEIGAAIRQQGGPFDITAWLDVCYYGPK